MNFSDPKFIRSLVALCLFFLGGFLLSWNIENYRREKVELVQDLSDQMRLSVATYQDSIVQQIFKSFNPKKSRSDIDTSKHSFGGSFVNSSFWNLGDSIQSTSKLTIDYHSDSLSGYHQESSREVTDSSLTLMFDTNRDRKIIVWNRDITQHPTDIVIRTEPMGSVDLSDHLIVESLETTFEIHKDSSSTQNVRNGPQLYKTIDSIFTKNLDDAGFDLEHDLTVFDRSDDSLSLPEISIPLGYGSILGTGRAYVFFDNYQGYLFKKMSSSLLLSSVLFLVVLMSFLAILKSWMAQHRLSLIKNEFVSNMTHELKTPISTIGVALEALENFGGWNDPEKRKDYLEISKHEVNRLKILVDKVLKMSTLNQDEEVFLTELVDMSKLSSDTIKSMKLLLESNNVELTYTVVGNGFNVLGDKVHLTNVLYNVLDNALKHSGSAPDIIVALSSQDDKVLLQIEDNGKGIPKEYQSKVFDRFFRVPSNDVHNVKGHGLGLHYVKTILEKHDGIITVESSEGKGTSFLITLPRVND